MKANEIMTGDYFRIARTGKIIKIVAVDECSGSVDYFDGDAGGVLTIGVEKIEPIPLTAEILEKNGWKDISDHTLKGCETFKLYYEQKAFDYYITIKLRDYFKLESYDDRFYTLCEMEFGCRYVHELQHALRLCGIGKEIVLTD